MDTMGDDLRSLLAELREHGREHDTRQERHDDRLRNLELETAALLAVLVRSGRRRSLLEIGTSNGYSTVWLAWAAEATGGRVTSVEMDPGRQRMADENLRRAGLRDLVDLKLGDATEVVEDLPGPFDLVFFDADRVSAPAQLKCSSRSSPRDHDPRRQRALAPGGGRRVPRSAGETTRVRPPRRPGWQRLEHRLQGYDSRRVGRRQEPARSLKVVLVVG